MVHAAVRDPTAHQHMTTFCVCENTVVDLLKMGPQQTPLHVLLHLDRSFVSLDLACLVILTWLGLRLGVNQLL